MPWRRLFPGWNTHATLWLGALVLILTLVLFYWAGMTITTLALNTVVLGIAVITSVSWGPAALLAFKDGGRTASDKIIISVWGAWTVLLIQRIYALGISITTVDGVEAKWLTESPIQPMIVALICVVGAYASYATVTEAGAPKRERSWMIFSTGVGVGVVVGVIGLLILGGRFILTGR